MISGWSKSSTVRSEIARTSRIAETAQWWPGWKRRKQQETGIQLDFWPSSTPEEVDGLFAVVRRLREEGSGGVMEVNRPEVLAEVQDAFERYERAFQQNDLEVLDAMFWDDQRVVRFGVAEDNYGIDEVRAWRTAQPTDDLLRTVTRRTITTFGETAATAFIEFRRDASGVEGRQSQTWALTTAGWKVVAAHVSHRAPGAAAGSGGKCGPGSVNR